MFKKLVNCDRSWRVGACGLRFWRYRTLIQFSHQLNSTFLTQQNKCVHRGRPTGVFDLVDPWLCQISVVQRFFSLSVCATPPWIFSLRRHGLSISRHFWSLLCGCFEQCTKTAVHLHFLWLKVSQILLLGPAFQPPEPHHSTSKCYLALKKFFFACGAGSVRLIKIAWYWAKVKGYPL